MLPTRPQLQGWNPDSLTPAGSAVAGAGASIYQTVQGLGDEIERMPEAGIWAGKSHTAATAMFRRGTERASKVMSYAESVGAAFKQGDASIGGARHWLLRTADEIDAGKLTVNDEWVVLIKPERMSESEVAELEALAAQEQSDLNELLLKVGDADEQSAEALRAAAQRFGFELPDQSLSWLNLGNLPPGDRVPNPGTPDGLEQQKMRRDADKAITVRDSVDTFDRFGNRLTKLTMQDGSRQEVTVMNPQRLEGTGTTSSVQVEHYDRYGEFVSRTDTVYTWDGTKHTNIRWAGGTQVTTTETPDGKVSGEVTTAAGGHGLLPDEFFTHPTLTMVGGGLTGLEERAGRGIPGLSPSSVEGLGKTTKFVGPALGVATSLYDTVTASSLQDACVAAFSGAAGVAGGEWIGTPLGAMGGAAFGPEAAPVGAFLGNVAGTWTFGYIGGIVGNVVCRP